MDFNLFCKLVDEAPGNPTVSFTGGEPLLHKEIAKLIAYAKGKGRLCALVTNGWMLTERAQEICEAGLDLLSVSLNGPKDIHNMMRGRRSYQHLVEGLAAVLRQPLQPRVYISMAISDLNYDKLIPTYELAKSLGVDGMHVNHLWMQTEKMVNTFNERYDIFPADLVAWEVQPEEIDVIKLADDLETIRSRNWGSRFLLSEAPHLNRNEISIWYRKPEIRVKYKTVRCGWIRFKVWPDGKVKPCRDWTVGDIGQQHMMEIWEGEAYREFRRLLSTHEMLPICTRCCLIAHR